MTSDRKGYRLSIVLVFPLQVAKGSFHLDLTSPLLSHQNLNMAITSDENLKLTIWPGQQEDTSAGLYLDMDTEVRSQAYRVLNGFTTLRSNFMQMGTLRRVVELLQGLLVEQFYSLRQIPDNLTKALALRGANDSELPCEAFQVWEKQSCDADLFLHRTRLKVKRTRRNLQELIKAFPDDPMLQEIEQALGRLSLDVPASQLERDVVAITQQPAFQNYLQAKERFLSEWIRKQEEEQSKMDTRALSGSELQGTLKALQAQRDRIDEKPEVLRYKNYQFFRQFNAQAHDCLNSYSLDLWGDEKTRDTFLRFMTATRSAFSEHAPFFVFRFENSFTYLLCGFPDTHLLEALEQNQDTVPVHAKIIMRQANQTYRELHSASEANRAAYHQCLREAMYPFVTHLNQRVKMELPSDFIHFFRK